MAIEDGTDDSEQIQQKWAHVDPIIAMKLAGEDVVELLATQGLDPELAERIRKAANLQSPRELAATLRSGTTRALERMYGSGGAK